MSCLQGGLHIGIEVLIKKHHSTKGLILREGAKLSR